MGQEYERLRIRRVFFAAGLGKPGQQDPELRREIQDELDRIDRELAALHRLDQRPDA